MTTGMVSCPLAAHSLSSVIPSVSGIQMSSRTRSGRARSRSRRASPALSATITWCPSSARISDSSSRIPTSSSTTRICAISLRRFRQGQQYAHRRAAAGPILDRDRKSTRLNSSHLVISYAVFCLKKKKKKITHHHPRVEAPHPPPSTRSRSRAHDPPEPPGIGAHSVDQREHSLGIEGSGAHLPHL